MVSIFGMKKNGKIKISPLNYASVLKKKEKKIWNNPPASEASREVYWNQAQKNFTHPYTEYPWVSVALSLFHSVANKLLCPIGWMTILFLYCNDLLWNNKLLNWYWNCWMFSLQLIFDFWFLLVCTLQTFSPNLINFVSEFQLNLKTKYMRKHFYLDTYSLITKFC